MDDPNDQKPPSSLIPQGPPPEETIGEIEPVLEPVDSLATDWAVFKNARRLLIPRPLFRGLVGLEVLSLLIIISFGYALLTQIWADEERAATAIIRATGTAAQIATATIQTDNRIATATAEERALLAALATTDRSEADRAATATAELQATATAESRATAIVAATQTSQIVATATAQRVAVADAAATATAHWQATATSQAVATVQARTTFVAEQQRTATAQRIATQSAGATQTAQAAGTATAEARIPPTMEPVPKINVFVLACDTGTDVRRGEVTNAWVTVQNVGNAEATNVEMTLSANDEAGEHPEKRQSVSYLPPDYQVTFKLSVDTRIGPESYVDVIVSAPGGITESDSKSTCATLDENAKRLIELAGEIGKSIPIPPFSFFRR